jgi:hypothetical protein
MDMSQTVGDFLVERLHAWGVRKVFGYPGDGIGTSIAARPICRLEKKAAEAVPFRLVLPLPADRNLVDRQRLIGLNGGRSGSAISGLMP